MLQSQAEGMVQTALAILQAHDDTGAINLLLDVTDQRQAAELRRQAVRCRRLAGASTSDSVRNTLSAMALEYEEKADFLDQS